MHDSQVNAAPRETDNAENIVQNIIQQRLKSRAVPLEDLDLPDWMWIINAIKERMVQDRQPSSNVCPTCSQGREEPSAQGATFSLPTDASTTATLDLTLAKMKRDFEIAARGSQAALREFEEFAITTTEELQNLAEENEAQKHEILELRERLRAATRGSPTV